MYQLKAFMVINSLINNEQGKVSELGELSSQSRSYSREIGIHANSQYPNVRLFTYYSFLDDTRTEVTDATATELLKIGDWLSNQAIGNHFTSDRTAFMQALSAEFAETIQLLSTGKMVSNSLNQWLPESIEFRLNSDTRENQYKIWFSDEAFRHQYDKFELEVIPPILTVDDFFKPTSTVQQILTENTVVKLHNRVNQVANKHPYTAILSYEYHWASQETDGTKLPTTWTVILYGEAGINADLIRNALAEYILKNSDYGRERWEKVLPDIFIPTEFYLCPVWTKFSTPNLQLQGGVHSPVMPYREMIPFALESMYGYSKTHLEQHLVSFATIFKSMSILACGHERNRTASPKFEEVWPEYANIYTTSRDFNRISPEAQEFIMLLNKMLVEAETMTPDSEIPQQMTRVRRGDMIYLTSSYLGVEYLMPCRYNYLARIALSSDSALRVPIVANAGSSMNMDAGRINELRGRDPVSMGDNSPTVVGLTASRAGEVGTLATDDRTTTTPAARESGDVADEHQS